MCARITCREESPVSYRTNTPELYEGKFYGESHHCVALVKHATGAPQASTWKQGAPVIGNSTIAAGTAIACGWEGGRYPNNSRGNHAAIYLGQHGDSIYVVDQWIGSPAARRYKTHKAAKPYHVIE
jgi:hypothetical protein